MERVEGLLKLWGGWMMEMGEMRVEPYMAFEIDGIIFVTLGITKCQRLSAISD